MLEQFEKFISNIRKAKTYNYENFICSHCNVVYNYFCDDGECSAETGECNKRHHSMAECKDCVAARIMLIKINGG